MCIPNSAIAREWKAGPQKEIVGVIKDAVPLHCFGASYTCFLYVLCDAYKVYEASKYWHSVSFLVRRLLHNNHLFPIWPTP